jgi:hypothetical protein
MCSINQHWYTSEKIILKTIFFISLILLTVVMLGCAFMYVKKELQSQTRPLIISHGFGSGFNSEFIWAGIFIFHLTCQRLVIDLFCFWLPNTCNAKENKKKKR